MIDIEAVIESDGTLRSCTAKGHAKAGKTGSDIVCAAVSVLMRTAFSVLSGRKGIKVYGSALEKGEMRVDAEYEAEGKEFLKTAGIFLIEGLSSIALEFPKNCRMTIKKCGL